MEGHFVGLVIEIANSTIALTPVDSGRLKNNWFVGIDEEPQKTYEAQSYNKDGMQSSNRVQKASGEIKLGDSVYFTNNLPYSRRIEYEGWSAKSPNGMLIKSLKAAVLAFNRKHNK